MANGTELDALKAKFREGRRAEAIAECEALAERHAGRRDIAQLAGMMHVMQRDFARALQYLQRAREPGREPPDLLFNIGMCQRELKDHAAAAQTFRDYTARFPQDAAAWGSLAESAFQLNAFADALSAADRAIALEPSFAQVLALRGNVREATGNVEAAVADYRAALALAPDDGATLKKATLCLLELGRAHEGVQLCRDVLKVRPDSLTAKLGAEWLLSQQVPLWHVPMMNEPERNQAFHDGLSAAVGPGQLVFEIGTGSGLLAMMAAKLGASEVVTCEAVPLVAQTAERIVARNGFGGRIRVLSKPSQAVQLGTDLPRQADLLVHEIFSSELLGEHVLPAIEDAKARLLKPGGKVLPSAASIMVALVGGDDLAPNLHAGESFGFDLREFNAIQPRKRPLYREDLRPVLMSEPVEAFRFDFAGRSTFPPEKKRIAIPATQAGECHGLIQWIRIELGEGVAYENHPSRVKPVSNWQHTVYTFVEPLSIQVGTVVAVDATHDRSRPWFELA